MVGAAALGPEVESQVLSRAEGNPFFLEELGRAVVEHGDEGPQAVPPTVQAALAARIDRLAPEDKRLLQTAAVIGRNVPFALLERVTGQAEPALGPGMARLVAAEFLFEARRRPERAFAFKHALTQAAAYAGLRADARRALHLRVAEALESQASAARPEEVEQFAHHAAEGGAVDKAVASLRRAAAMAAARGARREVVTCYERALGILDRQPAGDAQEDLRDLRFLHAHALYMAGEFPRALRAFGDARAGAEAAGDDRRLSQILAGLSYVHASEGRYAEAAHAGEQALGISMAGDVAVSLWTSFGLARSHFALGNYRRAAECARWGIEALAPWPVDERFGGRAGNLLPAVAAGSWLALALARTGDFDEGTRAGEAAVRAADAVDGLQERVWACYGLGRLHHARTDFARAIALLRRAADLSEGGTVPIYFSRVLSGLGSALYQSGAIDAALPLLERALDDARRMNLLYGHSLILVQLGEACLAAGRDGEAERHAAQALAFSRERGERGDAAWALLLHGEIAAARGEGERGRARDWLDQAVAISEELAMRPLAARCRMARGELEISAGRPARPATGSPAPRPSCRRCAFPSGSTGSASSSPASATAEAAGGAVERPDSAAARVDGCRHRAVRLDHGSRVEAEVLPARAGDHLDAHRHAVVEAGGRGDRGEPQHRHREQRPLRVDQARGGRAVAHVRAHGERRRLRDGRDHDGHAVEELLPEPQEAPALGERVQAGGGLAHREHLAPEPERVPDRGVAVGRDQRLQPRDGVGHGQRLPERRRLREGGRLDLLDGVARRGQRTAGPAHRVGDGRMYLGAARPRRQRDADRARGPGERADRHGARIARVGHRHRLERQTQVGHAPRERALHRHELRGDGRRRRRGGIPRGHPAVRGAKPEHTAAVRGIPHRARDVVALADRPDAAGDRRGRRRRSIPRA